MRYSDVEDAASIDPPASNADGRPKRRGMAHVFWNARSWSGQGAQIQGSSAWFLVMPALAFGLFGLLYVLDWILPQ